MINDNTAVTVQDLVKRFDSFTAVNHINFTVGKGEIFGFLGPNGAGKSTTIKMLCGILPPTAGTGRVGGYDIVKGRGRIKRIIGYMSQKFSLYQDLTVEENIDFYSGIYNIPTAKKQERKEWIIEMAGLEDLRGNLTRNLSGGWKQRLALGCAVLHEPPIVFLDEPTSGVDPISRRRFWDLIYDLTGRGVTVFVTTHYMEEAEYCDRIGIIYRGELIASGSPAILKKTLMHEDVLEVVCDRPQDAMGAIEKIGNVREVALFGRALHVVAANGEATAAQVRVELNRRGYRLERVAKIQPSLEDVFVTLIEARDQEEQPIQEVAR